MLCLWILLEYTIASLLLHPGGICCSKPRTSKQPTAPQAKSFPRSLSFLKTLAKVARSSRLRRASLLAKRRSFKRQMRTWRTWRWNFYVGLCICTVSVLYIVYLRICLWMCILYTYYIYIYIYIIYVISMCIYIYYFKNVYEYYMYLYIGVLWVRSSLPPSLPYFTTAFHLERSVVAILCHFGMPKNDPSSSLSSQWDLYHSSRIYIYIHAYIYNIYYNIRMVLTSIIDIMNYHYHHHKFGNKILSRWKCGPWKFADFANLRRLTTHWDELRSTVGWPL